MRFDISNFEALRNAVTVFAQGDREEALVLVLRTPGGIPYRFIVNEHGIEKQQCGSTGEAIE
jgi:hypothetical protein